MATWIKASERLPRKIGNQIFRQASSRIVLSKSMTIDWIEQGAINDMEWLDETADDKAEIERLKGLIKEVKRLKETASDTQGLFPLLRYIDKL